MVIVLSWGCPAQAADCEYIVQNEWADGFTARIRITNSGSTNINGWQVSWDYTDGSRRTSGWNAVVAGNNPYTATPVSWNANIAPGDSVEFGMQGTKGSAGPAQVPVVTGDVCGGGCTSPDCLDSDGDGVVDADDACPGTPSGVAVDATGCPLSTGGGISAQTAVEGMGKGFNLGQMFDNDQHAPTLANAKPKIDAYYNRGHRHVRVPITWTQVIDGYTLANPSTGVIARNTARLAELIRVVDYALGLPNMYVVINTHHEQDLKDNNRADVLERLWRDITDIFGNRDNRLIFELLNEPHLSDGSAMPPQNLRNMSERAYDVIRAADPDRLIVIGGNQWFGAHEMALTWPNLNQVGGGQDPYLMATFHHYHPWSFHGNDQGDYADNWTFAHMGDPMDQMRNWANSVGQGMPFYIGEWGTGWGSRYPEMNCNNIRYWYTEFHTNYAAPRGLPTTVWDDGGWFMIFNHATGTFANNLADCIDGACAWQGDARFNSACL